MPRGLGEMAHRVDDHQRALPAGRLVGAADPPILQPPRRQLGFQPCLHSRLVESSFASLGHGPILPVCMDPVKVPPENTSCVTTIGSTSDTTEA